MTHSFPVLLSLFFFAPSATSAPHHLPARSFSEIQGPFHPSHFHYKSAVRVTSARVLFADYLLIRRDFETTRSMSNSEIDVWLLDSGARVSQDQIDVGEKRGVNSSISHDPRDLRPTLRPPNYGRALIMKVDGGIFDAKGAGGLQQAISQSSHRNGLMETAEAIREFAYSKLLKKALHHSCSRFGVIDSYAVIDFGFLVKSPVDQTMQPAGLLLRQSHFRDINRSEQLENKTAWEVERSLRTYGITSAYKTSLLDHTSGIPHDVLNIQGSDAGRFLFDFGGYRIKESFANPAITLSDLLERKFTPLASGSASRALQPATEFKPVFSSWGGEGSEEKIWIKSRQIAELFKIDRNPDQARKEISALLDVTSVIPAETTGGPGSCVQSLKHP